MRILSSAKLALVSAFLFGANQGATAQDYPLSPIQMPSALDFNAMSQIGVVYGSEISDQILREPETPAIGRESGKFVFSQKRSRAHLAQFVTKAREQNPAAAADLERTFATMDIIGEAGKGMRAMGLDPHNVADAYALWWVLAWSAGNQVESPSDALTYQAVQAQARAAFAATPGLAGRSDAEKQQFAEAMIVQGMILDSANDAVRGNPAQMKTLADQAKRGAKEMGLDLSTMVLTSDGFRPRKGGALEVSGNEERLAANDGDTSEATPLTTYAALAAAGGAGVAAIFLLGKAMGRRG